jgi:hypothetical protein
MLKEAMNRLLERYGYLRLVQVAVTAAFIVLTSMFLLALVIPVGSDSDQTDLFPDPNLGGRKGVPVEFSEQTPDVGELAKVVRGGLFKAESQLADRPLADRTIRSILSSLTLVYVMEMGGEPVAYIDMKPDGVRQCKVGENVKDRFKVVNIDVEARSVEITIVGHKVKLSI